MAQTDSFALGNVPGATFRGTLNEILAALQSTNSGATAPTATAPGMLWFDTTSPGVWKYRNAANDAWRLLFGTLTNATLIGSLTETIFELTGTTPALDPANGTIQTWTLTANSTPTDSFVAGESVLLMVDDGTARTITWPSVTWVNNGGVAPTLATTGFTVISLWKVSSVLYGALVGDGS